MVWFLCGGFLILLIVLTAVNFMSFKKNRSKILWMTLSWALPIILFGTYYRYAGYQILEEAQKMADLVLAIFQFCMVLVCVGLIFILQLVMIICFLFLKKKHKAYS